MVYAVRDIGHYAQTPLPPRVSGTVTRRTGLVTPGALGRPKPAVIGTGKVDGIPVYGLSKVITTNYRGYQPANLFADMIYPEPTSVATIDVGYLLCKDYFGRGYSLIRLEADGEVLFDAENGAIPKVAFRFYNGLQTAVDPITKQIVGATNAGAHTGDVLIFLPDYPSLTAPTITAVISNAATDTGGTEEIAWTGTTPTDMDFAYLGAAYDPVDGIIYQVLTSDEVSGLGVCYLSVLDVDTHVERYRVPLSGSEPYVGGGVFSHGVFVNAIRGTGFIVIRFAVASEADSPTRIYNAATGAIVAEWREAIDQTIIWFSGEAFGDKWLLVGADLDGSGGTGLSLAVLDVSLGTISVTYSALSGGQFISNGRVSADSASFFTLGSGGAVYEIIFNGDTWTSATAYTAVGTVTAVQYDPETEYLVVLEEFPGGTFNVQLVTPDTGALADAFTVSLPLHQISQFLAAERGFSRPGYLMVRSNSEDLWTIDINARTATKIADVNSESGQDIQYGFFDQARLSYYMSRGDTVWTEYTVPGTTPGQVTLESHITDILVDLGPYTIDQIEFIGLAGLSDWGDVIDKDGTNIRTLLRTYQDPLGFVWSDIGSKIIVRKTPTDGSFVADETLVDADLVFKKDGSINSDDESDIKRLIKVSLSYISKDDNYQPRTVSADAFSALYEVSRSTREATFSTSLVLSDVDGERLVNEMLWNLQAKQRVHSFAAYGEFARMVPGDVVIVPSGNISYTVELSKVNIKENGVVEFEARDFQTSLSADVAAVTNAGFSGISTVTLQTQYIHLNIPLLRYADDTGGASLVQYGMVASRGQANWGGGTLYEGGTASELTPVYDQAPHEGVIGVCIDALGNPVDPFATTDASTVTIRRISGDVTLLVDKTEDQVLAGQNLAFIGVEGRWEGVGYKTVTDNGDGTFTLSGLTIRGYRGTEVFAGLHQAGDLFVMVSQAWVKAVLHPITDIGATKFYKAVGLGQTPSSAITISHGIIGAAETPYACINLDASIDSPPNGIDLSWDYRSRLAAGTNPANFGEVALAFEIDIYDGVTYKRTLTATTNSKHYASADVVTDFGSDPPAELFFRVFMMSALDILVPGQDRPIAGRGYEARHHTVFDPGDMTADNSIITADSTAFTADAT